MPPVNDDFAAATDLGSDVGSLTFSNVGATTETGEPDNAEGHSSWFTWTPTVTGAASVDTAATPLPVWDSYLAVFTGSTLGGLVEIANDDDGDLQPGASGSFGTSKATWAATAGIIYHIQITAWDDVAGPVERADAVLTWAVYAPAITSFTPAGGPVGTTVDVYGHGLLDVTSVDIGGVAQSFSTFTDEHLQVTVTVGTTTDYITAHTASSGDLVSGTQFVVGAFPTITGIVPSPAVAAETVVVTGTHFAGTTAVTIGGIGATFTVDSGTQITATVPRRAVSGEPIAVTNSVGTGLSAALTIYYPGPWVRPADRWAPWLAGSSTRQVWQATWADADPMPSYPTTAEAPNITDPDTFPDLPVGWRVYRNPASYDVGTNSYTGWKMDVAEWVSGVNFDNDLPFSLPPIRPSIAEQTAPGVADFETELPAGGTERGTGTAAYGAPLGDVQVTIDTVPVFGSLRAAEDVWPWASTTPADSGDIDGSQFCAVRIEPADYTWVGPAPSPTQWLTDGRLTALTRLDAKPVADLPLTAATAPPAGHWIGNHNSADDTLTLDLTIADLDVGATVGGYAAAFASSLFVDDTPAALPAVGDPGAHFVGKGAGPSGGGTFGVSGRVFYRPPRYRLLHVSPLSAMPRLRQSRRDDFLGGAPRQGARNGSRSVQASARQGWRNNYR